MQLDPWPLLAGLGLFLFGIFMLEEALKQLAGRSFKTFLRTQTNHPVKAVLAGVLFTMVLQSSSMAALLVMSFAGAGIIGLKNGIGIILGANLGTTITGWLVALVGFKLDIGTLILPFLAVGGLGIIFLKSERWSNVSKLLMGFSFMFLGLDYMKSGFAELAEGLDFTALAGGFEPLLVLAAFVLTAAIQSSSAAIMIFLSSLAAGVITVEQSFFLVIGADLGTTTTAIIGTLKGNQTRKKVGWSQVLFNLLNGCLALLFMPAYVYLLLNLIGIEDPLIALVAFHSLLNIAGILIMLPFLGRFARFLDRRFASNESVFAKFLHQANPQESQSALAALEKEAGAFVRQALHTSRELFRSEVPGIKTFEHKYNDLKEYEAEVVGFYQSLQQVQLLEEEVRKVNGLVAAVRNATLAAKSLKDIVHNLRELAEASDQQLHEAYLELAKEQRNLYNELEELLDVSEISGQADLELVRQHQEERNEWQVRKLIGSNEGRRGEMITPTLLNLAYGLNQANEAFIRSGQHFLGRGKVQQEAGAV